jgi:putative DNA primase/helicase
MNQTEPTACHESLDTFDRLGLAARRVGAFRLTDVEPKSNNWLWPGRIPLGYVTLLASDPGLGKSLVSLDIAARVTTGRPWPDEVGPPSRGELDPTSDGPAAARLATATRPPATVLILNIEDHFTTTVRPRLDALGADCTRILAMSHIPGEGAFNMPRPVAINRDINRLEMLLREVPDCRLIILDPITAFFGDTSNRSTGNVWKVLSSLSWLAASANLAVLAVSHLRKKEGAAIYRMLGSLAFVAAARAAWTISTDHADANRRLLMPLKNNLAESARGLAFTIESLPSSSAPIIRWQPEVIEDRADSVPASTRRWVGRPDGERQFAVQWLRSHLSQGQSPVRKVREAAEAHGITWGTLRRAFRELGAEAVFKRVDGRIRWDWKLPAIGAQNYVGEFCAPCATRPEKGGWACQG